MSKYNTNFDLNDLNGHWDTVIRELTGHVVDNKQKQCPFCGGNNRFQYTNIYNNGTWICRKCQDKDGTGFVYIQRALNIDASEARKRLIERYGSKQMTPVITKPIQTVSDAIIPAPAPLQYVPNSYISLLTKSGRSTSYQYVKLFDWLTEEGEVIGYIGRMQNKSCHQIYWTAQGWKQGTLGDNRPLFGLETLKRGGPVIIVEGEKTQDFVSQHTEYACVTWTGGAGASMKSDWSPIKDRSVYLCADNDQPGFAAMAKVKTVLRNNNCEIFEFHGYEGKLEHWDLADVADPQQLRSIILSNSKAEKEVVEEQKQELDKGKAQLLKEIRPLGFDKEKIFFLPSGKLQVIELNSNTIGKGQLRSLAATSKWEAVFPKDSIIDPVNWDQACDWVIRECEKKKVYDQSQIRGNGIWRDKNDTVVHMGDYLLVGGKRVELNQYHSKFVYAQRPRKIELPKIKLSEYEKKLLVRVVKRFNWTENYAPTFLLSFILTAPLAARLHWRPNIWINGPHGSGKTTISEKFVKLCLAGLHIGVEGETTEAGIRQTIGPDALPVLFDEPEADSFKNAEALQKVVRFIRSCASGSSSMITKGSSSGTAVQYQAQCMFLLSSINVIPLSPQDKDRISILEVERGCLELLPYWKETEQIIETIPEDINIKLFDFVLDNYEWILSVIKVFCDYVANKTGSQRIGDQYGILSIGEYILMNEPGKIPTEAEAAKHIDSKLWNEISISNQESNESNFTSYVSNILLQVEDEADGKRKELSLRECFDIANNNAPYVFDSMKNNVIAALGRRGMQVKDGRVSFVKNNYNLLKLFSDKPQFSNYIGILKRLQGAEDCRIRIGGNQFYAVTVPMQLFGEQNWQQGEIVIDEIPEVKEEPPEDEKELTNGIEVPW